MDPKFTPVSRRRSSPSPAGPPPSQTIPGLPLLSDASSTIAHDSDPSPRSVLQHTSFSHYQDIAPDQPRTPSQSRLSSRRALTKALELAREAVQLDSTNHDPHAAVMAYGRSVDLLSEVMERVRRGEDSTERPRQNGKQRNLVAQEEEVRRLKSIHDTYADRMNILRLTHSIPLIKHSIHLIKHSPSSVNAPSTSTESTQPVSSPFSLTSDPHRVSSYPTEHTKDEPQHANVSNHNHDGDARFPDIIAVTRATTQSPSTFKNISHVTHDTATHRSSLPLPLPLPPTSGPAFPSRPMTRSLTLKATSMTAYQVPQMSQSMDAVPSPPNKKRKAPEEEEMPAPAVRIVLSRAKKPKHTHKHADPDSSQFNSYDSFPSLETTATEEQTGSPSGALRDLTNQLQGKPRYATASGGFGDIWKCCLVERSETVEVAVKTIRSFGSESDADKQKKAKRVRRELKVWGRLRHGSILPLWGVANDFGHYPAMVCPWAENGALTGYLERQEDTLSCQDKFSLLKDITLGLQYLHSESIMHGDLTGANVLIYGNGRACLADFGLSTIILEFNGTSYFTNSIKGNIRWAAAELFEVPEDDEDDDAVSLSVECDIYSFGSIMLQVLTCKVPYYNLKKDNVVLGQVIRGQKPEPPKESRMEPVHWEFIQQCWLPRARRPSVAEVVTFVARELQALSS